MSPVYPTPDGGGLDAVVKVIKDGRRQQRENALPDAAQLGELVQQVQMALANINATVAAAITANSYTKTVIDNLIANPPAGSNVTGNVTASGTLIGTAGVRSPGARANVLTSWIAAQMGPSGDLGIVSSSVFVKQDFAPVDMSDEVQALLSVGQLEFRYIQHVVEYGDEAPWMLGSLAEYFEAIGLGRYVSRNDADEVDGINYADLTKPLIATVQHLNLRLFAVEERLAALEQN